MNLLIVGATGGTGRQPVAQALERGHRVTALVRHSRWRLEDPNLTQVRGDVLEPTSPPSCSTRSRTRPTSGRPSE